MVKVSMMVSINVHRSITPEDLVETVRNRLTGIGRDLDVRLHYILPDASETARGRGADQPELGGRPSLWPGFGA